MCVNIAGAQSETPLSEHRFQCDMYDCSICYFMWAISHTFALHSVIATSKSQIVLFLLDACVCVCLK